MTIKNIQRILLIVIIGSINNSCVEEIELQSETFESALVIEATITNEIKQQEILLSRTFALESTGPAPERFANVKVVDDALNEYIFQETNAGRYLSISDFGAQPNRSYTLKVTTSDGRTYASQPILLTQNTQIDNLYVGRGFNEDGIEGMSVFVDSFDPTGNSKYYRYTYEETYKIIAPKYSIYEIIFRDGSFFDHDIRLRTEQVQICYNTDKSNDIIITSTVNLNEDRLDKHRVLFINRDNYIISHRYSILVKQHVQSREAFAFYEALKGFSESESIFSESQPGFFGGNVFSEDSQQERVIGFFEVSSVDTKRVYFNYVDFFPDENLPPYTISCNGNAPLLATPGDPPGHPLFDAVFRGFQYFEPNPANDPIIGTGPYILMPRACGDCTALGKTEIPDFWID